MKLKYCLLAMLWPVVNSYAQSPPVNVQPLTIGDTVPDITLTSVSNTPVSKIQLSELKGKLIILDFWGRYCAPCILALAKLDSLQQMYGDQLQVITISDFTDTAELYKTLGKFKQTKNLRLPVLLKNELLEQYFPFTLVSHLVWIGKDGVVKAITSGEWATAQHIDELLSGKTVDWPVKKDAIDFDYKQPLLSWAQAQDSRPQSLYYSTFTSHMPGISAPNGTYRDSSRGVAVTLFYNLSLLNLAELALDYTASARRQQFILQVQDTGRYIRDKRVYYDQWALQSTYCYYLQLPLSVTPMQTQQMVQADIRRWLSTLGIEIFKTTRISNGRKQSFYVIREKNFN